MEDVHEPETQGTRHAQWAHNDFTANIPIVNTDQRILVNVIRLARKKKWESSFSLHHSRFSYQPKHIYIQTEENTPINERAYVHVLFSIIWRIVKSIIKYARLWKREKMKQVLEEKCLQVLRRRLISRAMHFDKRIS